MQTKKTLTKLRLVNWHYFGNETITFKGVNLFSGENGAGKSTILDAIQLVLTTNSRKFNLAANTDSKRTLKSYVRGKTGEEGNEYIRSGAVISYIALEVYEEAKQRYFVLGAKFDSPDMESDVKRKWFCEEGTLDQLSFITDNKPSRDEQFKNNGRRVSFIQQTSVAKDKFRVRLGHLQDNFFELIAKSLAFKPMKDVKSFVSQFILPERSVDIEALRENIRNLKEMQLVVEEVKRHVNDLEEIQGVHEEMLHIDEQILVIDILIRIADYEANMNSINEKQRQTELEELDISKCTKAADALSYDIENLSERCADIKSALNSGENVFIINALKNEIAGKRKDRDNLSDDIRKLKEQMKRIRSALTCVSRYSAIDAGALSLIEDSSSDIKAVIRAVSQTERAFREAYDSIYFESSRSTAELISLKKELERLSGEIKALEHNKITYNSNVTALKDAIEREFSARGIPSEARILADLLEITDSSWQNAVEGYLNTQRFYIIVEPQYYDIAAEVYDRNKSRIHTAAIVNTAKLDIDAKADDDSLANVVTSENRYARAYVHSLLGKVAMCESVSQLKEHSTAITRGCMLYKGNALRKINPEIYRLPYIGKYALAQQLKLKKAEHAEISAKHSELSQRKEAYETELEIVKKCNFEMLKDVIDAPSNFKLIVDEIKTLEAKLKDAENDPSYLELKMELERIDAQLRDRRKKLDAINNSITRANFEKDRLEKEIELLKSETAQAKAQITEMSAGNEDALADAKKKYREHKKTKSADTIFSNYQPRQTALKNRRSNITIRLNQLQAKYKNGDLGTGEDMMPAYIKEYNALAKHDLISYEEKLRSITNNCETEFRESFLAKMRENIENAIYLFKELNKTLKPIYYGSDSYRFDWSPDKKKKRLYEMIMSDFNLSGYNLFSTQFDEEYHDEMDELFSKLMVSDINGDDVIREYTDYRGYLDYDIDIVSRDGKTQKFSKTYREKSGGETQTPYYVAIAASFVQMYSIGESIRIIMLDEAFDKMDEDRIESMIRFFTEQGLQVILAAPTSRLELIGEHSDNIIMIYTDSKHNSFSEVFSYDEI